MKPIGVVLAGGASRRMGGGEKYLLPLNGRPVLDHVIDRVAPQVSMLALNANGDSRRFAPRTYTVIDDGEHNGRGPLAGILAGLKWCRDFHPGVSAMLSVPADAPFLPYDLAERLGSILRAKGSEIAVAGSGSRTHWVVGLWSLSLIDPLDKQLQGQSSLKVEEFVRSRSFGIELFGDDPFDPFLNINRPADFEEAARIAASTS